MITFSAESNEFDPSLPRRANVTLPSWVNEPLPSYSDLLSARDVARLTRRSRWVLSGLMLLGLLPNRRRYQGRPIGWNRNEVLEWVCRDLATIREQGAAPRRCSFCAVAVARSRRAACRVTRDIR
jgi:predicted DNA-binding transcriptional regulator AlpA